MTKNKYRQFLKDVPDDFPLSRTPYKEIADRAGFNEDELIDKLNRLKQDGIIRRVVAILYHRRASYTHNAMVVWKAEKDETEKTGSLMASFPEVSHCYERDTGGYWDYNLYTMIHGKSIEDCLDIVRRISEITGKKDYKIFFSEREFKKTSIKVGNE